MGVLVVRFLSISCLGGWLLSEVLLMVDFQFHPAPLMVLCAVMGLVITYALFGQYYGALFAAITSRWADISFFRFTSHYKWKTREDGLKYVETHSGPRLLLRFIPDAGEFDKSRDQPNRVHQSLERLLQFEMIGLTYRKIAVNHEGYQVQTQGTAGGLTETVNQSLAPARQTLAMDIVLAVPPDEDLGLLGIHPVEDLHVRTMYNQFHRLAIKPFFEGLDWDDGLDLIHEADHLPFLASRSTGAVWTVMEGTDFNLKEGMIPGRFEALKRTLGCEILIHICSMLPHQNEVRRAAMVSSLSLVAANLLFRKKKNIDFQTSLNAYKSASAGETRSSPRLTRGLVLLGRKVRRSQVNALRFHCRDRLGMDLGPLSGAAQTKAVLSMIPGWEPEARHLGHLGIGVNTAPGELCRFLSGITGSWSGDLGEPPYLILDTFDGESYPWSPWADTAPSTLVAGETGSGKSFLVNQMVLAHVASSPQARTVIIDYGGSFLNLVEGLGGMVVDRRSGCAFAPLGCLPEKFKDSPESLWSGVLDDMVHLTMDLWLYRVNLSGCATPDAASGLRNLFDEQFRLMLRAVIQAFSFEGRTYGECLELCHAYIKKGHGARGDLRNAFSHLEKVVRGMTALKRTYLHPDAKGLNLGETGGIHCFNLDGYPSSEAPELLTIILLNGAQLTSEVKGAKTLFLIDEYFKINGGGGGELSTFVEAFINVVRKYSVAMVICSQRAAHFSKGILEATQSHIALIQDKEAPPQWKITHPGLVKMAREASPAADVGYSTVVLAKKTGVSTQVQIGGFYRAPAILRELFESNKTRQLIRNTVAKKLGVSSYDLARLAQGSGRDYAPIGSEAWYAALMTHFENPWLEEARCVLTDTGLGTPEGTAFLQEAKHG